MTMPAVAIPSPEARGGTARVSLWAEYPVMMAMMLQMTGAITKPSMPVTKLATANPLVGSADGGIM
jgi:hypothetical protein